MNEPTLTELRETARMIVDCAVADNQVALARAFLALTDPEPLTAEHCREAGMIEDDVDGFHSVWMRNICDHVSVTFVDNSTQDRFITNSQPTRGDLRIATARRAPDEP